MTRAGRHRVEQLAVLALAAAAQRLPRRTALAVGTGLGLAGCALHRRRRVLAAANLQAAWPDQPPAARRALVRAAFVQIGRHVMEFLRFDAMRPAEILAQVEVAGAEHVERAMAGGRGVMYYAGHFGNWELQILAHALRFEPIAMVARTLDNPLLDARIGRMRRRVGTRVLPRRGAMRHLLRTLRAGGSVGMMIDQHIQDRSAVTVEFLGRPASTTSAIAALALRTGAPIIPVFTLPLPDGRYRLLYEAPIAPPAPDDPDPIRTCTQRCTDRLAARIRRAPHLWLWMHRRWRAPRQAGPAGLGAMR